MEGKEALLPPVPCNLNCDKVFPPLSDQYTIPKWDSNPPKQSEDRYQSAPLPPSHHSWVVISSEDVIPFINYLSSTDFNSISNTNDLVVHNSSVNLIMLTSVE